MKSSSGLQACLGGGARDYGMLRAHEVRIVKVETTVRKFAGKNKLETQMQNLLERLFLCGEQRSLLGWKTGLLLLSILTASRSAALLWHAYVLRTAPYSTLRTGTPVPAGRPTLSPHLLQLLHEPKLSSRICMRLEFV